VIVLFYFAKMKVLIFASLIALVAAAGANAAAVKGQRILKKSAQKKKKGNKGCSKEACVSTFQGFKTEIGKDKSSAEINICPGATITFEEDLYVYSDTTDTIQDPFDLKLLCCDCNCVLDTAGYVLWFGKPYVITDDANWNPFGELLSAMKLTMRGIKVMSSVPLSTFSFMVYLPENSYYQEVVGGCPNTIDLASIPIPFYGYGASPSVRSWRT